MGLFDVTPQPNKKITFSPLRPEGPATATQKPKVATSFHKRTTASIKPKTPTKSLNDAFDFTKEKELTPDITPRTNYVKSGVTPPIQSKIPKTSITPSIAEEMDGKPKDAMGNLNKTANVINAIQGIGSGLLAYQSVKSIDKMKPALVTAPHIEAARISDTGAQQRVAGDQQIESSVATAREDAVRSGRTDLGGVFLAKELEAKNSLAGQIEGYRTNIEATNAGAENRVREINANADMQAANINQQAINTMNQFKTQMKGATVQAGIANVSQNMAGIVANTYGDVQRKADLSRYEDATEMELATMIGRSTDNATVAGLMGIYRKKYPNGKYL